MNVRLLFVHALAPLHAGTGQGVGVIDLPIAREVSTGLPYLPGSSVKGTLRDCCGDGPACTLLFGPPAERADEHAGSVQLADQRLLLLPVRSLRGTFAWVTAPYLLHRFAREAREVEAAGCPAALAPRSDNIQACRVADQGSVLLAPGGTELILEDLDLQATADPAVTAWAAWLGERLFPAAPDAAAWRAMLQARLCVVHDDILTFLLDTATEVQARVHLNTDSKTVRRGGLWYEEALPAETVLAGLVAATPVRQSDRTVPTVDRVWQELRPLTDHVLQFGGKATVGRGLCRVVLV